MQALHRTCLAGTRRAAVPLLEDHVLCRPGHINSMTKCLSLPTVPLQTATCFRCSASRATAPATSSSSSTECWTPAWAG